MSTSAAPALPTKVTCILSKQCLTKIARGLTRPYQPKITTAMTEYKEGFLPCGHWACPLTNHGMDESCASKHMTQPCTTKGGKNDLEEMEKLLSDQQVSLSALCIIFYHFIDILLCMYRSKKGLKLLLL